MSPVGRCVGLVLGVAGFLVLCLGGLPAVLALLVLAIPLAIGRDGLAFLAGLLSAFGTAWLGLLTAAPSNGGTDLAPWFAVGAGALVLGIGLGAARVALSLAERRQDRGGLAI